MKWNMKKDGYVKLEEMTNGERSFLQLTPSPLCLKDLRTKRRTEGEDALSGDTLLWEVLADHLETGWERVEPEEIGALTSAPVISNNVRRDDNNEIIGGTHVYAYMSYQVRSAVRDLLDYGFASWEYASLEFSPEQQALEVFYDFMRDKQDGEVAMNHATDLLKRLKKDGLQIVKQAKQ